MYFIACQIITRSQLIQLPFDLKNYKPPSRYCSYLELSVVDWVASCCLVLPRVASSSLWNKCVAKLSSAIQRWSQVPQPAPLRGHQGDRGGLKRCPRRRAIISRSYPITATNIIKIHRISTMALPCSSPSIHIHPYPFLFLSVVLFSQRMHVWSSVRQ